MSVCVPDDNGNVGIGTTDPTEMLHVNGNIVARSTYPEIFVSHNNGTVLGGIRSDALNKLELKTVTSAPISLQVNSSEKMRITDSGNVGIGNTDADERLHVSGNVLADNFITEGSTPGSGGGGDVTLTYLDDNYYDKTESDGRYLQSFTETDPIYTASSWFNYTEQFHLSGMRLIRMG